MVLLGSSLYVRGLTPYLLAYNPRYSVEGSGNRTAEGYRRQITGEGNSFRERQRESGVRGVWGGTRGWIPVESLDDSTREGRTTAAPLGPLDDWGAQDIQN